LKFKFIIFFVLSILISGGDKDYGHSEHTNHKAHKNEDSHDEHAGEHHESGSIDGKYIMDHIQGDAVFEIFNPFDYNDANGDHYYFTKKINLVSDWNKSINIPIIGGLLNWKWDPSESLSPIENSDQLMFGKQFIMMMLAAAIIILLFVFGYKKDKKIQSGIGNLLEIFVLFIRDEVVYPNMGEKQGRKFLPLILTFFFFIVTLNLLGLIPGSATTTASFSFTVGMALITFFTYVIFGNKDFWKHIFATPGVPLWLLPIMIPVELIGLLTKPFALSVRLLANMNAGHIIIMAFLGIIINMKSPAVAIGSVPMAIAINMLEIFVAFLQGYIFSLLSSIFIGMAVVEHEHH